MFKKILVAYDNGSKAKKALDIAIDMAKGNNAEIHLVSSSRMTDFISQVASPRYSMIWKSKAAHMSKRCCRSLQRK